MRIVASLAGAFWASALLLVIVDAYTPGYNLINMIYTPLFVIFIIIWTVSFGYATVEANLKKKIIAVLVIEAVAIIGSSIYFMITRDINKNIFGLTLGVGTLILMFFFRSPKD